VLSGLNGAQNLVVQSGDTRHPAQVAYTEMLALNSGRFRLAHFAPILPLLPALKKRPPQATPPDVDPEITARLRAMGYLE
jgi:hypothetical protein